MIKELEEAKQAIEDIIFNRTTAQYYMTRVDQILNIRGNGWRLAIVKDDREFTMADTRTFGFPIWQIYKYKAVIWQADE